jgi:hypothetical protein
MTETRADKDIPSLEQAGNCVSVPQVSISLGAKGGSPNCSTIEALNNWEMS